MAITRFTDDMDIIAKLADRPNDVDGLSAAGLKAKFDESGGTIKDYINNTLLPFLESASAAANIGVDPFSGLVSTTLQDALEELVQSMADITQGSVADGSITTVKLADGAVDDDKLDDGAVVTAKLASQAVTTAKIALLAITTALLADGAVTEAKLASGAVTEGKIGTYAVTTGKLAAGAVNAAKLAADAVTSAKILNGAITSAKLADAAVTAAKLASNAVETAKIKDGNVTSAKLANGAVTEAKLGSGAVTNGKIADAAVTDAKLAATAAIRMKKLWENASPESSFGEQDVSISGLSGYDQVLILYWKWETTDSLSAIDSVIGAKGQRVAMNCSWSSTGIRHATIYYQNTNKIHFSPCIYNGANYNTYCVPLQIYGIKGVQ